MTIGILSILRSMKLRYVLLQAVMADQHAGIGTSQHLPQSSSSQGGSQPEDPQAALKPAEAGNWYQRGSSRITLLEEGAASNALQEDTWKRATDSQHQHYHPDAILKKLAGDALQIHDAFRNSLKDKAMKYDKLTFQCVALLEGTGHPLPTNGPLSVDRCNIKNLFSRAERANSLQVFFRKHVP